MLADSRLYPRVATNLEARVGNPGDNSNSQAWITDISLGGVTIKGDNELAQVLTQDNPQGEVGEHVVCFDLSTLVFNNVYRLVHVRRLSQAEFEFGMKFLELGVHDVAGISDYINNHVRRTG